MLNFQSGSWNSVFHSCFHKRPALYFRFKEAFLIPGMVRVPLFWCRDLTSDTAPDYAWKYKNVLKRELIYENKEMIGNSITRNIRPMNI